MEQFLSTEFLFTSIRIAALLLLGLPLVLYGSRLLGRATRHRLSAQQSMIAQKAVQYLGVILIFVMTFQQLGFSLAPLLGAAGIVGIALGFASQTSVSNVISGIFLIAEKPFEVGDVITIGDATGFVLSIDVLSVKIRGFDNRFIRIPNETVIKSQVINVTRFPIRRLDVTVSVAYKEDLRRVREVLLGVAKDNPICLQEPEPLVIFSGFGSSSIDFLFAVWTVKENFLKLRNSIQEEIKSRFDQAGIEIPFPHLSIYAGLASEPFKVELINQQAK